jgi:hypothetical protein
VIVMPVFPLQTSMQRNLVRAVMGCALAALVLGAAPARAQEETPEMKILDKLMGAIGLSRGPGEGIDYRERSPLVLPPSANASLGGAGTLPPPQTDKIADPNWPVDPEVKEARAIAAMNKKDDGRTSSQRMDDQGRPMLRSELEKGRTNRRQNNPTGDESGMRPSSWTDLGYKGGIFSSVFSKQQDEAPASFTGEPPRTSLIAPPSGYQTPSPNQPYALGKGNTRSKAVDYYTDRAYDTNKN